MESIYINYAESKYAYVRQAPDVEALLRNEDVLLVGEGNFTFTVALAAIRGNWNGIVSTRYEAETRYNPRPQFDQVKKECIKFCRSNGKSLKLDVNTIQRYINAVERVGPPPTEENWLFGIDATNTPESFSIKGTVVLFQCPWLQDVDPSGTPATLITKFLLHMSTKQNTGDYVLIGITTHFPYVINYNLEDLLGKGLLRETDNSGMYNFLGADDTFIQEILKHGYHHQSCHNDKDIHEKLFSKHLTLVFQRNGRVLSTSESNPSSEDSA